VLLLPVAPVEPLAVPLAEPLAEPLAFMLPEDELLLGLVLLLVLLGEDDVVEEVDVSVEGVMLVSELRLRVDLLQPTAQSANAVRAATPVSFSFCMFILSPEGF
jgi:hypothetical protein